jgi:hypothetical protein
MQSFNTHFRSQLKYRQFFLNQSEEVFNAAYDSDWYNQSGRYKYFTRMLIMRAQRPVRLTAGRFGTLSLPLFSSVSATHALLTPYSPCNTVNPLKLHGLV